MADTNSMAGRYVLITGAGAGIGKAIATVLARRGAEITVVTRDEVGAKRVGKEIANAVAGAQLDYLTADLSSMRSVRALAAAWRAKARSLHVLIHSAGVIDLARPMTDEGLEINFAVNYLGRYLLTALLDDLLTTDSRVVALATPGVQPIRFDFAAVRRPEGMSGFRAYQQSQAANDVWGVALAEQLRPRGAHVAVVSPGIVRTGIRRAARRVPWWLKLFDFAVTPFAVSPEQGAQSAISLASDLVWPAAATLIGPCLKAIEPSSRTRDTAIVEELTAASRQLVRDADAAAPTLPD